MGKYVRGLTDLVLKRALVADLCEKLRVFADLENKADGRPTGNLGQDSGSCLSSSADMYPKKS